MLADSQRPDQQEYWNANLDPQNLGAEARNFDYAQELAFYITPDQRFALQEMAPLAGKRFLEIGAGIGTNALHLAGEGGEIVAIDIAEDRLRLLAQLAQRITAEDRKPRTVRIVKAAAEHLPFRDGAFDRICSKSVMIHTKLELSVPEAHRVAAKGAVCAFIEPRADSPLVNLYRRTLAPKIWQSITTYFTDREIGIFRSAFPATEVRYFYLLSFLAFVWQFAIRSTFLFGLFLRPLHLLDSALLRMPFFSRQSWFAVLICRKA